MTTALKDEEEGMTASEARHLKKEGDDRRYVQKREKEKREEKERNKRAERALKEEFPKDKVELDSLIKAAAGRGEESLTHDFNDSPEGKAVSDALVDHLNKKGFVANTRRESGEDNMGDFNAPCTVYWSRIRLFVSWEKVWKDGNKW